jgi:hypothetical protein
MSAPLTPEEIAQARRLCEQVEHVLRVAPPAPGQSWRMVRGDLLNEMAALLPRLLDALEAASAETRRWVHQHEVDAEEIATLRAERGHMAHALATCRSDYEEEVRMRTDAEDERDAAYDACAALGWRTPADETIRDERDRYRVAWEEALLESTRQHERAERLEAERDALTPKPPRNLGRPKWISKRAAKLRAFVVEYARAHPHATGAEVRLALEAQFGIEMPKGTFYPNYWSATRRERAASPSPEGEP